MNNRLLLVAVAFIDALVITLGQLSEDILEAMEDIVKPEKESGKTWSDVVDETIEKTITLKDLSEGTKGYAGLEHIVFFVGQQEFRLGDIESIRPIPEDLQSNDGNESIIFTNDGREIKVCPSVQQIENRIKEKIQQFEDKIQTKSEDVPTQDMPKYGDEDSPIHADETLYFKDDAQAAACLNTIELPLANVPEGGPEYINPNPYEVTILTSTQAGVTEIAVGAVEGTLYYGIRMEPKQLQELIDLAKQPVSV